ncbi:MAG: alpha/beta hydrolase [Gammaproteobacteria bacterium]|nr:alpha/beta hydrolase [Gammaproteobacteria bacterium]MDE2345559.1 alpha/beta hydrolase [Gammaproteobacteria bacterium]
MTASTSNSANQGNVVFVHGLYMTGLELGLLRLRVGQGGFQTHIFHYHTLLEPVQENARLLLEYLRQLKAGNSLHLVGHSLGGLVILRMFELHPDLPPGRVVLMGSPVRGSIAARSMMHGHWGWLLGQSGPGGLADEHEPVWDQQRELGILVGTAGPGLRPRREQLPEPHDGLVSVQEARIPGATDMVELDVHHTGMLFSQEVADQVVSFLNRGRFHRSLA